MNIFSKIKNFFSPFSLSYKLVEDHLIFNFIPKLYKNGWLSFFAFISVNSIIGLFLTVACYFHIPGLAITTIILLFIHNIMSFANWICDNKYFFTSAFRTLLFKATKKYDILVKNDKHIQKQMIEQEELGNFIKEVIAHNDVEKKLFAELLTKKNFKPFTKYELLKFSMKHCESSDYVRANFNEIFRLYQSQQYLFTKKKEDKFSKGLEIIDCLASGKKLDMNEKGQIIINNQEHLIAVKQGE